jgi:hypothetical protein
MRDVRTLMDVIHQLRVCMTRSMGISSPCSLRSNQNSFASIRLSLLSSVEDVEVEERQVDGKSRSMVHFTRQADSPMCVKVRTDSKEMLIMSLRGRMRASGYLFSDKVMG